MKKYLNKVKRLIKKFNEAHFVQIPREENMEVDILAKEASVSELTDEFDEIQYFDIFLTDQYNLHATHFFNSHQIHLSHDVN